MDVEKLYYDCEHGNPLDMEKLRAYFDSFENVVIWGAGNLGTALGTAFIEKGLKLDAYWDAKWEEKKECNGLKVLETFAGDFEPERTLVIVGIVNGTKSHLWQGRQLQTRGYTYYLFGMTLYEGLVCPMRCGEPLEIKRCVQTNICNFNTCQKYMNILKSTAKREDGDELIAVQVLEFIVSRRCTLDCVHCGQQDGYVKRNFPEKYIDYPLERIKKDIDIAMDNIDVVGTFSVIGGEPFIHPQIFDIVEHCLTKKNVAIISITTNGVCNMPEEGLRRIKNDRVKINFSNYTESLSEQQKKLFWENVEKVRRTGIYGNNSTPIWTATTNELREDADFSEERLKARKKVCVMGPSIANGKFYACPQTELYYQTEQGSVAECVIDLKQESENRSVREKIRELLSREYYVTCGYRCTNSAKAEQVKPGEQYGDS